MMHPIAECPVCRTHTVWYMPEEDVFGRCRRCCVVLAWNFCSWRMLSEVEWMSRHRLADLRPWARRDGIAGWQREFYSGPQVWWVRDPDGWPSNFYDSPEAAQFELDFRARNGERGYSMCSEPVHTLKLSRERWLDPVSVTQPGGVQ